MCDVEDYVLQKKKEEEKELKMAIYDCQKNGMPVWQRQHICCVVTWVKCVQMPQNCKYQFSPGCCKTLRIFIVN